MKRCFVISPIGDEATDVRQEADILFEELEKLDSLQDYEVIRADKIEKSGNVTNQVIRDVAISDLVIINLNEHNPNVYYEMAIRHCTAKPYIIVMSEEKNLGTERKWYFNLLFERVQLYNFNDLEKKNKFIKKMNGIISKFTTDGESVDDNPITQAFAACPEQIPDFIRPKTYARDIGEYIDEKLSDIHSEIAEIVPQINEIMPNIIEQVYERGKAEYIRGEDEAFKVLAECTSKAKEAVRSTRFSPWSVMKQTGYMSSILECMKDPNLGNKPRVKQYHRIICTNNKSKKEDVLDVVLKTMGTPLTFYLTEVDNNFEIVVIDNSDAFLHFYDERRVIVATLHVQGGELVREFERIFDRLVNGNVEKIVKIDCKDINYDNLNKYIKKVEQAFEKAPSEQEVVDKFGEMALEPLLVGESGDIESETDLV